MKILKLIISLILCLTTGFLIVSAVKAEEDSDQQIAQKYKITFPIPELGNCSNITECKAYCDDSSHQSACIDFAKTKGFYKQTETSDQNKTLAQAKTELGCTSVDECRVFCQKQENISKCSEFAQKHKLGGSNIEQSQIQAKAKQILGCSSMEECKAFCQKEENHQKCADFAKSVGLGKSEQTAGPGRCNSEESCKSYCLEHRDECSKFEAEHSQNHSGVSGPGGCNSPESCNAYCQSHPQECGQNSNRYYPSPYPTNYPSVYPTNYPSVYPTNYPSSYPTYSPTSYPSYYPTYSPTKSSPSPTSTPEQVKGIYTQPDLFHQLLQLVGIKN